MSTKIEIDQTITVGNLAEQLLIPVTKLIAELMKNGVMATVNERIDYDTAQIIVGELELDVELTKKTAKDTDIVRKKAVVSDKAVTRPPVVAVMGHVDHGKTSLLDAIRSESVAKGEAGGITQHISAYQVTRNDRIITLLDTPGHEAFAALREHGAQLTDLVVIVVAADDGVKPQTIEAIRFARKAGVKIVVAINKMDKEGANVNQVKQQLADQNLLVEEYGGDIVAVPVSAKTGKGIDELLDMILLLADVEDLKADVDVPASGLVIEAHMEQGRGAVAIALVEAGTLKPGQFVVAGGSYARVRNLETTSGKPIKIATPSTPVIITGFKTLPAFADTFIAVNTEKLARAEAEQNGSHNRLGSKTNINSSELIRIIDRSNQVNQFNVIIKADVQGSLTSVMDGLKALDTEEVAIRVVGSGIGAINENDIHLAHSSKAAIYGFHLDIPTNVKRLAARDKVSVRLYKVIYELLDDAKKELELLLPPEIVETSLGRLLVRAVFKTSKTEVICGGEVTKGKLTLPSLAKVFRGDDLLAEAKLTNLKRGPAVAKEIIEGEMCGLSLATEGRLEIEEGDRIEFITRETVTRKLS